MWAQAEQMKAAAVLKSRDESSIEMERTIKKINRQHEKALKVLDIDLYTSNIMLGYSHSMCDKKIFIINSNKIMYLICLYMFLL